MKILTRFLLLAAIYVGGWFLLSQINWVEIFKVEEKKDKLEEKLGELIKEEIERSEDIIRDDELNQKLDSLLNLIAKENNIDTENINIILVDNKIVNAFALPADYMVIHSGLIETCENEEMLMGVMAHELAHIEQNHVMKKLVKEIGVSVLAGMVSGNSGGMVMNQIMSTLSSTAFDRSMESEADEYAIKYLMKAKVDPRPLADFFYLLSMEEPEFASNLSWLSTHPASEDRAVGITDNESIDDVDYMTVMTDSEWDDFQSDIDSVTN